MVWDDENYYLIGFDDDSKEIRHYRVDKMLNITITAEKRDGGDQFRKFDIGNYSKRTFGMFAPPFFGSSFLVSVHEQYLKVILTSEDIAE